MLTREKAYAARPPIAWDSVEGWLRRYALAYANLRCARAYAAPEVAAGWQARCEAWVLRLSQRLPPERFTVEIDQARRYGEQEAEEAAHFWRRA